jgi:hypothetical protein
MLQKEITDEEIKEKLCSLNGNKTPGPNTSH